MLAARVAKRGAEARPVCDWTRPADPSPVLAGLPIEDLWGIGSRWGKRLRALGIRDALALRAAEPRRLRQHFGVVLERFGWGLRGCPCLALEAVAPPRQQIRVSRSFGALVTTWPELRAAVIRCASRAGEKLRAQGLAAPALTVFIQTSPFDPTRPGYSNAHTQPFAVPTQDSRDLVRAATRGLARLVRPGDAYVGSVPIGRTGKRKNIYITTT